MSPLLRRLPRALAIALVSAAAGAAWLAAAFALRPAVRLEMDRDPPRLVFGFHPIERDGEVTFAWTTARAGLRFPGLDRSHEWLCRTRVRAARPRELPQPAVQFVVDGVVALRVDAPSDFEDIVVPIPANTSARGLTLLIDTDPVFVPGPDDPRQLGVQVDVVDCGPASSALPPSRALAAAAASAGIVGLAFALLASGAWTALAGALAFGAAQAVPLASGWGPYTTAYTSGAIWRSAWTALAMTVGTRAIAWLRRQPLGAAARFAVGFSAAACIVKLLALLHPAKPIVDALFHARKLDAVLDGQLYFTQPMPDGVAFPYAIGLYLFAAPWSLLASDHMAVLRIVVTACEAAAGIALFAMVVRAWDDARAAAIAVVLFHLVPVPYAVIGNANLTNAFGQSAALMTMAAVVLWPPGTRVLPQIAVLTVLATLAFLSHVSTIGLLMCTLLCSAALFWWRGGATGRATGRVVLLSTVIAGGLAVALYYGHFGETYRTLARVRADSGTTATLPAPAAPAAPSRVGQALRITVADLGWPLLILAGAGLWRLSDAGGSDRLVLVIAAWAATYLLFVAFGALVPVGARFERYAAEFIGRVDFATYPAAVLLGARAASSAWRQGSAGRLAAIVLIGWAATNGIRHWTDWIA